ncbi:MAG TPA: hypothetical protein PKK65_03595 [bacterium]|jgi:hypothetical protein|nr:MAG: hypothetical protein BWX82_00682 [Parcubacteria group bacterium ADurb.Bin115]HNU81780.1 hypothetical protein [bacterium]HOD87060.1 hypothetical protein [bacterium]HQB76356.1 hypothetical protein [bacterium]HQQ38615.1 hypothetical protein [bacterium]
MSFQERLQNEPGFIDNVRYAVEIDKMSPDELLDLPIEAIQEFSIEDLNAAMEKIMHGFHHLTLDKNNRSGFDVRWRKFLDTALTKI